MKRNLSRLAWMVLLPSLFGCQAQQMVKQYAGFDAVITDVYEKHVLYNLARRDAGRTMVQMDYKGFSANLNSTLNLNGKVQFFTNPQDTAGTDGASISLNAFRQSFEPMVNNSSSSGLAINSAPATDQDAIRALYDEQIDRPDEQRVFRRTSSPVVAMRAYAWVRTAQGDLYYVPFEKHREFSDFVHRVSFYKPGPQPATAPTTQPTRATASRR